MSTFKTLLSIIFVMLLLCFIVQVASAQQMDKEIDEIDEMHEIDAIHERLLTIEKKTNQTEYVNQVLSISGDTVKYVGTIASLILPFILLLIGYQIIRSYQFEKEIRETRTLMIDEYQKMQDIRIKSEQLINETKSKMDNLGGLVGDLATEYLQKTTSNLVAEVKEQTNQAIAKIKTKEEEMGNSIELMKKVETLDLTLTPSVYVERGKIYLDQGNNGKSIENFNKAIELKSDNFDAYFNRGLAYHRTERYDEAINDYMKASKIRPDEIAAYANIGTCYREKKETDYEKSIQYLSKAIKLNPKYEFAYIQRSITYTKNNKYDLAINDLKQIETLNQKSQYILTVLFRIGLNYGKMGKFNSAIEYYLKRFKKEKSVSVALNLTEGHICKKDFPNAEKWANESYALSDTDRDKIMSKFLLITTLILNNKEYRLELNEFVEKIKISSTFEVGEWSFDELLTCLTDQSLPAEKVKLVKKMIASLKKEIKPEELL